jgi:hypothetical protein
VGVVATFAQTLNVDEVAKLKSFLAQESAVEGRKNYEQLAVANLDAVDWKQVAGLTWNANGRLDSLMWQELGLAGDLDIGGFAALRVVHCETNSLRSLNVAGNTAMVYMDCFENELTQLDVTSNVNLREFCCRYNQLTGIDISRNTKLIHFCGTGNQFEQIDISHNTELGNFFCANNRLKSVDLSHNKKLVSVALRTNRLTTLDASDHPQLRSLTCYENELESLDIAGCPELTQLECSTNHLTALDVTGSPKLGMLTCHANELTALDLSANPGLNIVLLRDNRLTFSSLPQLTGYDLYTYTYAPQAPVAVEQPSDKVDLSSEYTVGGKTSVYAWTDAQGVAVAPASGENGVFAFGKQYTGQTLTCRITNAVFPDLTMEYRVALTTPTAAVPHALDASRAYAANGHIHVETDRPAVITIHTVAGGLLVRRTVPAGATAIALPKGIYVVSIGSRSRTLVL